MGKNTNHFSFTDTSVVIPHTVFYCMRLRLSAIAYLYAVSMYCGIWYMYICIYAHVSSLQFQLVAMDDENLLQTIVCLMWDSSYVFSYYGLFTQNS